MDLVHLVLESVVFVSPCPIIQILGRTSHLFHIIIVFQLPWHAEGVLVRIKHI